MSSGKEDGQTSRQEGRMEGEVLAAACSYVTKRRTPGPQSEAAARNKAVSEEEEEEEGGLTM